MSLADFPQFAPHVAVHPNVNWLGLWALLKQYGPTEVAFVEQVFAAVSTKNVAALFALMASAGPEQIAIIKQIAAMFGQTVPTPPTPAA